jgi:hypothetical protein
MDSFGNGYLACTSAEKTAITDDFRASPPLSFFGIVRRKLLLKKQLGGLR